MFDETDECRACEYADDFGPCEGHESLDGAYMGASVLCDGSCNPAPAHTCGSAAQS